MLAVWPDSAMKGYKALVRPSMEKFPSNRNTLEVRFVAMIYLDS